MKGQYLTSSTLPTDCRDRVMMCSCTLPADRISVSSIQCENPSSQISMHCHLQATLDTVYEGLMRTITNWSNVTDLILLSAGIQPEAAALCQLGLSEKKMPLTIGIDLKGSSIYAAQWKCERPSFSSVDSALETGSHASRKGTPRYWRFALTSPTLFYLCPSLQPSPKPPALSPCLGACNEHVHALHQALEQRWTF